jgi:hypothetical protein
MKFNKEKKKREPENAVRKRTFCRACGLWLFGLLLKTEQKKKKSGERKEGVWTAHDTGCKFQELKMYFKLCICGACVSFILQAL